MDRLTYRAMYQSIRTAKHHINLEVFILEHHAIGEQLIDLLDKRRQQGIQVNLIYDAVGSAHTPDELFASLEHEDGKVVKFNAVNPAKARANWAVDHRDHRKLLIIDGHTAFTEALTSVAFIPGAH